MPARGSSTVICAPLPWRMCRPRNRLMRAVRPLCSLTGPASLLLRGVTPARAWQDRGSHGGWRQAVVVSAGRRPRLLARIEGAQEVGGSGASCLVQEGLEGDQGAADHGDDGALEECAGDRGAGEA